MTRPDVNKLLAIVCLVASTSVDAGAQAAARDRIKPNVVLVLMDDMGYGDIGSYGVKDARTPNLDRLAREGVRLTDAYANAANCSPTRTGLISGQYQQRWGIEWPLGSFPADSSSGLPVTGVSLPALLKKNGYATGLIGKWHLGFKTEFGPNAHGFDEFWGFRSGALDYYTHRRGDGTPDLYENTTPVEVSGYLTDEITRRAVSFVDRHATAPFFLEVAYNAVHWPFEPPDMARSERHDVPRPTGAGDRSLYQGPTADIPATRADYVRMLERADEGVGKILAALDRQGLTKHTLVIFTNDNGGEWLSRNAPLSNRKSTLWEGGIRVPLILRWPGRLPANKTSGQVAITMDLTASILEATGTPVPADYHPDGISLLSSLSGKSPVVERQLFWRLRPRLGQRAVRSGRWKLLQDGANFYLFDVAHDPGERHDLTTAHLDLVRKLNAALDAWEKDVDSAAFATSAAPVDDWRVTGGDPGNSHYSALDQINRDNVAQLRVAWTHHTGDLPPNGRGEIQATPIVVDGVLYTTTPALAVIALRADSGTLLWKFDPFANRERESHVNRGVVYWATSGGTDQRILFTAGRRLYALDARTGRPMPTFGDSGSIDLGAGLSRDVGDAYMVATSPGVIYKDLLVQGTRVGEDEGSAPGDVRAYDVRTGAIRWTFHTIPRPGEIGYDTWPGGAWRTAGGANSWAGMAVDVARGIVYVPTGSATPDFYGGDRAGANLFANSLLALDAETGKRLWHFQTVHHDLWDRDLPAAPNLVTVARGAARVDAVAQIAKSGFVFLFDRQSGRPLFDIEERAVPASDLRGEHAWPTQPFPVKPAPFARQAMGESDLTDLSTAAHEAALKRFRSLRPNALFTPPSREGSIVLPGFDGGGEWGGAAVDPETAVLYVNASDVPWIAAMRESAKIPVTKGAPRAGRVVYAAVCASCHGDDRRGRERAPSLIGVASRLSLEQMQQVIERGRGFMPSFAGLPEAERRALVAYLGYSLPAPDRSSHAAELAAARLTSVKAPYEFVGYERWRDSSGFPAVKPPWGTLSAIDLNTGEYRWRIPLGEHASLTARGIPITGTEQYGGPIVTGGGLVFIAATQDAKFRALDKHTGALLWEATLPAPGYATPSTFSVRGKQYVVVAAGGGKLGSKSSDVYVAYSLR